MAQSTPTIKHPVAWYDLTLVKDLPLPHRMYAWWIKNGFKRGNEFTWGGNRLFDLTRSIYTLLPQRNNNYVSIPAYHCSFRMVVDLTDFEVPHHTLPLSLGKDSETKLLEMVFPRGGTFVDVGANYGFYSFVASYLGGSKSVVCAYEPQPRLVEALEMSKELNQFTQLRIKAVVLGARAGDAEFFIPDTGSGVGSIYREHAGKYRPVVKKTVNMETLDAALESEGLARLDILKIDVEGAEFGVLQGAMSTLKRCQPLVWFEMSPEAQSIAGQDQEEIYRLYEYCGYTGFYDIDDVATGLLRPIRNVDKLTNVLAVPSSKIESVRESVTERSRVASS